MSDDGNEGIMASRGLLEVKNGGFELSLMLE